jgi:hypothetical protein
MTQSFSDVFFMWLLIVGPILAWVALFWWNHRDSHSTRHQKELLSQANRLNDSLDRIARGGKK